MARQVTSSRWASNRAVYMARGGSVFGCRKGTGDWMELCSLGFWSDSTCRELVVSAFEEV